MTIRAVLLAAAVASVVVSGGIVADVAAAPSAQAACYGSVSTWKGKNTNCSSARHWDAIKNANAKYGPWVGGGSWSEQGACWANVVSYGMTAK